MARKSRTIEGLVGIGLAVASLSVRPRAIAVISLIVIALGACGEPVDPTPGETIDPTPERLDGSQSQEFEQEDIDRAAGASDAVKEYCSGAVSEAQRVGCESHVEEEDIP